MSDKSSYLQYAKLFTDGKMGRNFYSNTAKTVSSVFIDMNDNNYIIDQNGKRYKTLYDGDSGDLVFPRMDAYLVGKKYGGMVWFFHGDKIGGVMNMKEPYDIRLNSQTGTFDRRPLTLDPGAIFNP